MSNVVISSIPKISKKLESLLKKHLQRTLSTLVAILKVNTNCTVGHPTEKSWIRRCS